MASAGIFERIVVGTDGSATARSAVALATRLAAASGATLHLVSAYQEPFQVVVPEAMIPVSVEDRERLRRHTESHLEQLAACARAEGVDRIEVHCVKGAPAEALLDVAAGCEADLIVIGSVGMTGARRFLGSVPNRVTHHAHCNVLVVRTDTDD